MIYSIPAGDTYVSITDFNQPKTHCPHCKQQSVMVSVYQKYNHINWYPMYTKGKAVEIICTNCRELDNQENYPEHIIAYAETQLTRKSPLRKQLISYTTLFWLGLATFVTYIILMFYGD
ncbi:MAG TPA: hypothetical protein VK826_18860 [Bacteroidia bacterium]|nr:hypothetical protein [Bacteroidia bacterium]